MSQNHLVLGWGCARHLYLARLSDPALFIVLQFPVLEGLFPGIRHRCHWLPAVTAPQSTCLLYLCTFFFFKHLHICVCLSGHEGAVCVVRGQVAPGLVLPAEPSIWWSSMFYVHCVHLGGEG